MSKVLEETHKHPNFPRLTLDKRTNSRFYQARTFLDGKVLLKSTKSTHLPTAFKLGEDWYKRLLRASVSYGNAHPLAKLTDDPTIAELYASYKAQLPTQAKRDYAAMKWTPIMEFWRAIPVHDINAQTFRDFYIWRRKQHVKNNTLHKDVTVIRQILKFAALDDIIDTLPKIPPVGQIVANPRPWLTPVEWTALRTLSETRIKDAPNERTKQQRQDMHDFMVFMVHSMTRVGEALNLRFADCRVETNEQGDKMLIAEVTGKRGTRTIVALAGAASVYERRLKHATSVTERIWKEHHRDAFRELLEAAELRRDKDGNQRTLKSLRATSISFRILNNPDLNLTMIARNAGTSVFCIDQFYAKRLTAEMSKERLSTLPVKKPKR